MAIDVRADIYARRKKKGVNSDKNIPKESRIDVRADIEAKRKNTNNVSLPKAGAPAPKIPVIKGAGLGTLEQGRREIEAYGGIKGYAKALEAQNEQRAYQRAKNLDIDATNKRITEIDSQLATIYGQDKRTALQRQREDELKTEKRELEKVLRQSAEIKVSEEQARKAEEEKKFYSAYNIEAGRGEILNLKNSLAEAKKTETELQQKLNASNRGKTEDRTELRSELDGIKRKISAIETKLGVTEKAVGQAEKVQKQEWYNSIPFAEDFEKYSKGGFYGNYSPKEANKIKYGDMTDEEVEIYRYLANKDRENGTRESGAYLESLEDVLEYREGIRMGEKARDINNPLGRGGAILGYAAMSGLTNSIEGTASFLTGEAVEPNALDYAAGYIRNDIDGFAGASFDVTQSLSNMVPSILLSSITGIPAVGAVAIGASASGNAYSAAISEGYSENQARAYAGLTGASEAVLRYLLGGISSLGGKVTNNALARVINKIDGAGLKLAAELGGNMVSEGLEEGLQTYLEAAFRKTIFDEELNLKEVSEDAIYSAMLGAVTAFLLEGPGTAANAVINSNAANIGKDYVQVKDAVIKKGLTAEATSDARRIAEEMQKKLETGEEITDAELGRAVRANEKATGTALEAPEAGVELRGMPRVELPTKPGFKWTEYSKSISNKTIRALDAIGKKIGTEISIGAPTGDGKGAANGYYQNGTIVIAQDAKNPLEVVLCHEVTHHMQRTAPTEYNAFVELAINASEKMNGVQKSELINRYKTAYSEGSTESFSDQQAIDEITADFAGRLVNDISLFNDLANSNRNVAVRFLDSLKDFIAKVKSTFSGDKTKADTASQDKYGASVAELEAAVAQFEKMLATTETAVASGTFENQKDLIASHNVTEEQLREAISRGEFIMPSVGVTNKGHTAFGEISVILGKESIDPQLDNRNKIYGSDAWTPNVTKLKKNPQYNDAVIDSKLAEIKKDIGVSANELLPESAKEFKNKITKSDGNVYGAYGHNLGMQTAFAKGKGLIQQIPTDENGNIDQKELKKQLNRVMDEDSVWREYRKWLSKMSDEIIFAYDEASNEEILESMAKQPKSAKKFRLTEDGKITAPATEYGSIEDFRKNKNRLSNNATKAAEMLGQEFISFAQKIAESNEKSKGEVVDAINSVYESRYRVGDIRNNFAERGIKLKSSEAATLQNLYKQAVELPTQYFEAKAHRGVNWNEIKAVVLPDTSSKEIIEALKNKGIKVVTYENGNEADRIAKTNAIEGVKFSKKNAENAVASGNTNTAGTNADGGRQYSIKTNSKGKYVKADRQVVEGRTPEEWGESVKKYINDKIRQGEDVQVFADNGDVLTITANSAGKAKFRNYVKRPDGTKTLMTDAEYLTKLNAESHIDELSKISRKGKKDVPDYKNHDFAKDGFNYRTAYFQDFDGKYYKLTLSVGKNGEINTVYNVGQINEASFPLMAHRPGTKSAGGDKASNNIIPESTEKSNRKNSLKTADLLSPDYGKTADTSADTEAGEDTQAAELEAEEFRAEPKDTSPRRTTVSYIDETGLLDKTFDDLTERAKVISDERLRNAEAAVMTKPPKREQTFREKLEEAESYAMRKMVNSGYAIRKIADMTNDAHIYGAYNKARSSQNIASDMVHNKQTDVFGRKVGESLEEIIAPIKEKGDDYYLDFQLYLLHKHNVARMSLRNSEAEIAAQEAYDEFVKENPSFTRMSEEHLDRIKLQEDDRGLKARKFIELRNNMEAAAKNKPIFFEEDAIPMSAEASRARADELIRKHPEFKTDEAKIRKYIDNLMQYRIDSGLITQEEADYFKTKYPDYVPTYRDTEGNRKWIEGKVNVGKTIGTAKGSNAPILPLDVALAEMTKKVVRSGQKNIFANKLYDLYENNAKSFEKYITDEAEGKRNAETDIDELGENFAENTVSFYKDGRNIELTVTPELFEAFDTLSRKTDESPEWLKKYKKVYELRKKLVTTYDPTFGIRNGIKDLQDALLNSTSARGLLKNLPRAYKEIATGGEMWELYKAAGGLYSSRFEEMQNEGVKFKSKVKKATEKFTFANMMIEQAPRLAEFMTVYEKGDPNNPDTLADALLAAAEVTTNFGESGTVGKVLNAYLVPFLNPGIQGTAKIARTFGSKKTAAQWGKLAAKTALLGLNAAFFNELVTALFAGDDEEEYLKNVDDRTKDNYYLIPIGDGRFIKLPKGRVVASLGIINERVRDVIKGEKVDVKEALARIADNTLPTNPLKENIFTPWFEADLFNEESPGRTWYGTDIESESMQSLPVEERYDSSTDYISRYIGKALKVSPKKVNYILEQYTGGVGRIIFPMITPSEQKGNSVAGTIGLGVLSAIASNFSIDAKLSNKISGEFYDAVDAAEQKKNSAKGTLADKVVYKHLNRERNQMSSYNSTIREAENDKKLSSGERRAAVRVANAERTAYQETILENIPEYREKVEKYLKEYPGKDEEKKLEYAYREANRALYGEEYAIRVNGGNAVYKKAEEKVKRGKTTWKKYYDEYFGKTERRYDKIHDRFGISYSDFEKIEEAISKNSSKTDEIAAIQKLGYKNSIARRIYTLYHDAK